MSDKLNLLQKSSKKYKIKVKHYTMNRLFIKKY